MTIGGLGARVLFGAAAATFALSLVPSTAGAASPCAPGQPPGRPPGRPPGTPGQPPGRPPQYPPGQCQLRLSAAAAAPGSTVTATGSGFAPGSAVRFSLAGEPLQTAKADGAGTVTAALAVPVDASPGATQVVASGVDQAGDAYVLSGAFTVLPARAQAARGAGAARSTASSGSLVATGATTAPLVGAGVVLVAVGALATRAGRRRQGNSSH